MLLTFGPRGFTDALEIPLYLGEHVFFYRQANPCRKSSPILAWGTCPGELVKLEHKLNVHEYPSDSRKIYFGNLQRTDKADWGLENLLEVVLTG